MIGATYLRMRGFAERVPHLIEGHVLAKRYLTHKEPDYYDKLSQGSKTTLKFQGGPMTADEAEAFEASDSFEACLTMRRFDEGSKQPLWQDSLRTWAEYVPLVRRAMNGSGAAESARGLAAAKEPL